MTERAATADIHVAVDRRAGSAQALLDALENASLPAESPEDLKIWANGSGTRAVVLSLTSDDEIDTVIDLRDANWDLVVVMLTPDDSQSSYRRALRAGATAVAPADAPVDRLVEVVREAVNGHSILPTDVARRLALDAPDMPSEYAPSMEEIGFVQAMAAGRTMAEIAETAAMSKTELTKRLNSLYDHIGVDNRTEAIIKFARWGLLD